MSEAGLPGWEPGSQRRLLIKQGKREERQEKGKEKEREFLPTEKEGGEERSVGLEGRGGLLHRTKIAWSTKYKNVQKRSLFHASTYVPSLLQPAGCTLETTYVIQSDVLRPPSKLHAALACYDGPQAVLTT